MIYEFAMDMLSRMENQHHIRASPTGAVDSLTIRQMPTAGARRSVWLDGVRKRLVEICGRHAR
jgi:hypothetical protein